VLEAGSAKTNVTKLLPTESSHFREVIQTQRQIIVMICRKCSYQNTLRTQGERYPYPDGKMDRRAAWLGASCAGVGVG
jgi:hypothetical protein